MAAPQVPEQLQQLQKLHEAQQAEMQKVAEQLSTLAGHMSEYYKQKLENDMVLKELQILPEESTVFKKVGPCLIKQDMYEAKSNVEKRVEYISKELERIEQQKHAAEEKRGKLARAMEKVQGDAEHFVKSLQAAQQGAE